jgi:hypothetical protein
MIDDVSFLVMIDDDYGVLFIWCCFSSASSIAGLARKQSPSPSPRAASGSASGPARYSALIIAFCSLPIDI